MNAKELSIAQDEICQKIYFAREKSLTNEDVEPITDGIFDVEGYLKTSPRIMWVLKEPWDDWNNDGTPKGGGWFLPSRFIKEDAWKSSTWKWIVYSLAGIYERKNYNDLPFISEERSMVKYLERIAYINLSKMPAYKETDDRTLPSKYSIWKEIDLLQIRAYQPEIIYFGNTFSYFKNDLNITDSDIIDSIPGWQNVYQKDGVKYVDAFHPNCRKNKELYVNYLISAASL